MGRKTTLPAPWAELADRFGGVQQLAEACGASQPTLWRWARKLTVPGKIVQRHVNTLARRRGIAPPFGGSR